MKIVAVLIHDDEGQEARLESALAVTHAIAGHLTCIDVSVPMVASDPFGDLSPVLTSADQARATVNRARIEARLEDESISRNWVELVGDVAVCLEQIAAFTDLIVVDREVDHLFSSRISDAASHVLIRTGKPILAVPANVKRFDIGGHALIAWDGSASANAAMRAALPLLRHAANVTFLEIDDGSVTIAAEEAATYLARHGILAVVHPKHPLVETAGSTLLRQVDRMRADYLVMGGFGHGRIRERIFGGVTRTLLARSPVPLFLVHAPHPLA